MKPKLSDIIAATIIQLQQDDSISITEINNDLEFENDVLKNEELDTKEPLSIDDFYVFYVKDLKNDGGLLNQ
jgi:hypothetical protein